MEARRGVRWAKPQLVAEVELRGWTADGILRLAQAPDPPAVVRDYLELVRAHNGPDELRYYPGSAVLAQQLLRDDDRAILLELHPQELRALKVAIGRAGGRGVALVGVAIRIADPDRDELERAQSRVSGSLEPGHHHGVAPVLGGQSDRLARRRDQRGGALECGQLRAVRLPAVGELPSGRRRVMRQRP